ncbi:nucleoside deaminase [Candidatus Dependentiae bacterium]|nr:nucleoside deaminase [Candidatus Dependentiae bacterium]
MGKKAPKKLINEEFYMRQALKLAQKSFELNEVPIGAIVVDANGKIIGRGYNQVETKNCQNKHAEIIAIEKACKKIKDWRLNSCSIYVTIAPCVMCLGLITLSRIEKLVYGAQSPLYGADLDNISFPNLYKKHIKIISSGVLEDEAKQLLKRFFKEKRSSHGSKFRTDQEKIDRS